MRNWLSDPLPLGVWLMFYMATALFGAVLMASLIHFLFSGSPAQ